jgi:hypothetical protein
MQDGAPLKTEITRALLSPVYGKFEPAPVVRCHGRVQLPAEIATVLMVHPAAARQDIGMSLAGMRHAAVQVYELIDRDENQGFCFALDKRPWSFGPWSSDAEVLYCRIVGEHLVHLVVIGGTSVAWQGRPLLKASGPSSYFEWRKQDSVMNAEPAPFAVLPLFAELTGTAAFSSDTQNSSSSTFAEKH